MKFFHPLVDTSGMIFFVALVVGCGAPKDQPAFDPSTSLQDIEPQVFSLLSPQQTGVNFENPLPENDQLNILEYEYYYNGGGVAIGDVNGDKLPDLVFTANLVANRLFLNQGGLAFREASIETGFVSRPGWKTGVVMADVNADGHLDIYVCRSGKTGEEGRRNELFVNKGDGTFREAAAEFGLDDAGYTTHASFFDYDRDGDLDCFVLNHALRPDFNLRVSQVKDQRHPEFGDRLYRNDNGKFVDVSAAAGIKGNPIGFGLSITVEDFDRDGWLDLFIANDYTEQDYFYRNNADGTFTETLNPAMAHTSHFSMGSDAGDVNGDGWPDLMVLDMLPEDNFGQKVLKGPDNYSRYNMQVQYGFYHQQMRNTLQLNLGRGLLAGQAFSEVGQLVGVSNTDWSLSTLMADFDNDGDLDIHVTNGYVHASTQLDFVKYDYPAAVKAAQDAGRVLGNGEVSKTIPSIHKTNVMYRNDGPEVEFANATQAWGMERLSYSQGAAFGDLDMDGDLDLVVNNLKAPAFIYENKSSGQSVELFLTGTDKNPFAIGATVIAWVGGQPMRRTLIPARGFQSSVEPVIHIGIGAHRAIDKLEIIWPNGDFQTMEQVAAGKHAIAWKAGLPTYQAEDLGLNRMSETGFTHVEDDDVEFHVQPLLPHMLGRFGPCLAAQSLDAQSGEVFVGGGPGQDAMRMTYRLSGGKLVWSGKPLPGTQIAESTDLTLFDADGDGDLDLYLVSGGNRENMDAASLKDVLLLREGDQFRISSLPPLAVSGGCVAAGDADGDGDEDLFVGGRVIQGQYPLSPPSYLLLNDGRGNFSVSHPQAWLGTEALGMISDARWADLDGDGKKELIIVGEWSTLRIFGWRAGKFAELTSEYGLGESSGWWTRLEVADLDGDGDMDLLTGNMGENSQLRATPSEPLRLYAADYDQNGSIDPVITHFMEGKEVPIASRDELMGNLRFLQKQFPRYENYARATIFDLFTSEMMAHSQILEAKMLRSGWWEQANGQFVFHPWPLMAQQSPVFGQVVADFNADGLPDVLLAGNFYPSRAETGRFDASLGCLLTADGAGGFRASSPGREAGLWFSGDIRDLIRLPLGENEHLLVAARNNQPWIWGVWKSGAQ
ncbi:MAG: CRTAC1 family protein [Bacteroidia bacterium]|nr:CRTAC1 family protein [Bacteroidia bacterium]